ncbi:MAG: methyltransferase domain-containing protein, partial [Fulvivirga sp.]|nr:methyltransferase domain-containing protein [Fulvivirga sp.]
MQNKFSYRSEQEEIMDDLEAGGPLMDQTLKELETINKWLGGNAVTIDGVKKLLKAAPTDKKIRIVDLGCGGGEMLRLIADWATQQAIEVELMGIDANPHVIAFAEKQSKAYDQICYLSINILSEEFKVVTGDVFISTLFMHHFPDDTLIAFLKQLKKQASIGIVINDIHRHWLAYYSIKWLTYLFSKSMMVKN